MKIVFDHRLYPAGLSVAGPSSKGLRYGDGLFETMKVIRGCLLLASYHFERLFAGLRKLRFEIPEDFSPDILEREILKLCQENELEALARVRLNVFRGADDELEYVLETFPLEQAFDPRGMEIGVFGEGRKSADAFSALKSNNYLVYLMGAAWARARGLDECLILNAWERVADTSVHNLFYIMDGVLHTPPLSEGGVAGVMRRYVVEHYPVVERPVTPAGLEEASEVFLTNAIAGIRWVNQFGEKKYTHETAREIGSLLKASLQP